jgi:hypothetical protein
MELCYFKHGLSWLVVVHNNQIRARCCEGAGKGGPAEMGDGACGVLVAQRGCEKQSETRALADRWGGSRFGLASGCAFG